MRRFIIYTLILSFLFLVACSRRPSYVLSEKEMTDVLYDIQLAQAIFRINNEFSSDDKKDSVIEGILKKHGVSQAELDSSLLWYSDNIKIYVDINEEVTKRLKMEHDTVEARRNHLLKNVRDWSKYIIPPHFYLSESTPIKSFSIDSEKIKSLDIKNFNLSFDVQGINKNQDVEAAIYYTYKDSLIRNSFSIEENTKFVLKKPERADSLLKEVSGYIYMKNKIEGLASNILFYNVSYSDSTLLNLEGIKTPIPKESLTPQKEDSDQISGDITNKQPEPNKTKDKDTDTPSKGSDDVPVLSRGDVEKSPFMRRSRSEDKIKKDK